MRRGSITVDAKKEKEETADTAVDGSLIKKRAAMFAAPKPNQM
jgi:hypothetical protein